MTTSDALRFAVADGAWQSVAGITEINLAAGEWLRFDLASGGCWYGHGFAHRQPYPLESEPISNDRFAVNNIQSPIWMCSAGVVILAESDALLAVHSNVGGSGRLEISCRHEALVVRLFTGDDLPAAHRQLLRHLGWPNPPPAPARLGDSLFCTWTQYPRTLTQARVLDMARQIRAQGYPCSTLILDDRWESCYGDLTFAREFPDPPGLLRELHALGFQVWLWVTPFVNVEAAVFPDLERRRILVPRRDGQGAALLKWWGGTAGLVDVTAPAGAQWYRDRLAHLQRLGVDGFKIDGGDFKYQPAPDSAAWQTPVGPSGYSDRLLALFAEICPNACETRTAWRSQHRPILWREGGKDSHWGLDNGLRAMVTLGLQLGLLGYDILIPDMIPGRVQTMVADLPLPSDELLVRWTEASAFFPIMQFSYFPWNYAPATALAVRQLAALHKTLQSYLVEQATDRTAPLLRPLWYDYPGEAMLAAVADQFQLGRDLVVAPVLAAGQVARDVVLPPGDWHDAWTGTRCTQRYLSQHPAPCPGIPIFVRAENPALLQSLHAALQSVPRGTVTSGVTTARFSCGLDRDLKTTG